MKKRLFSILLCLAMAVTLLPAAMAAGRFTDVKEKDWFYADVEYAVEQGLVNGTTTTTYSPDSNLTYGAAIKLAACMHKKVTQGNTDFEVGMPWYQVYVDYAQANGIIPAGKSYDWEANATRAGYMEIFAKAIPDTGLKNGYTGLTAMNQVDDGMIPDVPMSHPQAAAIYKLYRAGILQGSNAVTHQCNPSNYIQRSEVATILTRMMDASKRISFEMTKPEEIAPVDGLTIVQEPEDAVFVPNGKAEFTVKISGGKGPYTYKWFESYDNGSSWVALVNDSSCSGVSTAKLTIKLNVTDATAGSLYRCTVTDAARGTVTTRSAAIVSSGLPLTFVDQPQDVTAEVGSEVFFDATAVGGKLPYTFQWQRKASDGDWQDFPMRNSGYETSKTNQLVLTLYEVDFNAGYSYRCKITDSNSTTITSTAATIKRAGSTVTRPTLTPSTSPLTVTEQPQNVTCKADEWVDFGVIVSGGKAPYTYQWQMKSENAIDWTDLSNNQYFTGTNTAELRMQVTGQDFQYSIQYRCEITDANGKSVCSDAATAIEKQSNSTVTRPILRPGTITRPTSSPLAVTEQPQNVTCKADEWVDFGVIASGGKAPYTYQWQMKSENAIDWTDLSNNQYFTGTNTAELRVQVTEQDFQYSIQYRCEITDANGDIVCSDAATAIEKQSTGTRPILRPGTITRPTTTPDASSGSTTTDTGSSSTGGTISRPTTTPSTSASALKIKTQPRSASASVGEKVTFTVEVTGGTSPYSYQWQSSTDGGENWTDVSNNTKYGGVRTATFTVKIESSDYASQSLIYRCRISDAAHDEVNSANVIAVYTRPTAAG